MNLESLSFGELLAQVSSKSPVPGGGAVTASVAALGAALGSMVLNYSVGRKDLAPYEAELQDGLDQLERARWILIELAAEDMRAYEVLNEAMKLPKDDPSRAQLITQSSRAAAEPPLATIAACTELLRLFDRLAPKTNKWLRSDLAIAAVLAEAAARASRWNVMVNAPQMGEPEGSLAIERADRILETAARLVRSVEEACGPGA